MTTTLQPPSVPLAPAPGAAALPPDDVRAVGRGWAVAGLVAGVAGAVGVAASTAVDAVYDPALAGDAPAITARLAEQVPAILVFHSATMLSALLLLVFAAGLARRLRACVPSDSLTPAVASSGLLLVSVAGLIGTGLTTEFAFGLQNGEELVPETAVLFGHWVGTLPWLWAGAGVAALAVAVAGRQHAAVPRWLMRTSAVLGGLTVLVAVGPLQYLAGMLGPVWLIAIAIAMLRER